MPEYSEIISQLVEIRHQHGLTVRDVAKRMCVTSPAVVYIETSPRRGVSVGIARLLSYANAVGAHLVVVAAEGTR